MGLWRSIKEAARRRALRKRVGEGRSRQLVNWRDASHVLVMFDKSSQPQADAVGRFVKSMLAEGKSVTALVYVDAKKRGPELQDRPGVTYLTREDLDWAGRPKPGAADDFERLDADLLLAPTFAPPYCLEWVARLSRAKTVVAPFDDTNRWANLLIDSPKGDYAAFLEQSSHYLRLINP